MSKIKAGGPAFPRGEIESAKGMSLRDYFAAKAMEAIIIGNSALSVCCREGAIGVSKDAYKLADAMLAERERGE